MKKIAPFQKLGVSVFFHSQAQSIFHPLTLQQANVTVKLVNYPNVTPQTWLLWTSLLIIY